jgi:dTDP-4-dehydrorhamnose 3,5-epimerase
MECPQGKLVRVTSGCVFDAVVDMRKGSPTFGASVSATLSGDNHRQLWVPPGFAHGFLVLSPSADFLYKTTDYYHPASEQTLKWDDAALAIEWPLDGLSGPLIVSEKDAKGFPLEACQVYP